MFASSQRRSRDERGSVTIQMVFLMPALFLLMFLGLQGALYYHAKQVALAAAQEGAREAGSETGTRESGVATFAAGEVAGPLTFHTAGDAGPEGDAGQPDPHFWTDPDRMRKVTALLADQVVEHVDGVDADTVRANADRYAKQLTELTAWMERSFGRVPADRRALVTNHHVFGYLADRFGLRVIGAVIPSGTTLASPSSSDLRSLTEAVDRAGVRTVFADSSQPQRLAEVLRRELGGGVRVVQLYSESLTAEGGGADTSLRMMRANTTAMVTGLTGR